MPKVLTSRRERAERLLAIMQSWWDAERVITIAKGHNVTRQMIYRVLSSTCCDWRIRRCKRARRDDGDVDRLPESAVAEARSIVASPFFMRLTTRQRAVVAWRATGAGMWATARRMGSCPSVVRDTLISAMWKIDRLTWEAERPSARKAAPDPLPEIDTTDIEALFRPQ